MLRADLVDRAPVEAIYAIHRVFPDAQVTAARVEGQGMEVLSPDLTDDQMNGALDAWTFTSSWDAELAWADPLPSAVSTHLQHLRDYLQADPAAITEAQTVHVVKDLIRAVHFLNKRLENEG